VVHVPRHFEAWLHLSRQRKQKPQYHGSMFCFHCLSLGARCETSEISTMTKAAKSAL